MQTTTAVGEALGRYLNVTSEQLRLTAANMANVDTPGYKTQGFDFAAEMARQWQSPLDAESRPAIQEENVGGLVARPDGNDVSMDREGVMLAKAQLQFRLGVELLKHDFANIMTAIHAEAK